MAIRTFAIPESASVADPAWFIACSELIHRDGVLDHIEFSGYEEIEELIANCKYKQAEAVGRTKMLQEICTLFNVKTSFQLGELAARLKEQP